LPERHSAADLSISFVCKAFGEEEEFSQEERGENDDDDDEFSSRLWTVRGEATRSQLLTNHSWIPQASQMEERLVSRPRNASSLALALVLSLSPFSLSLLLLPQRNVVPLIIGSHRRKDAVS